MTRRTRHQLRCQCCGLLFPSTTLTAKWCSNACNQHAFRQRRKAAALVAQPELLSDPDDLPPPWNQVAAEPTGLECRTWKGTAIQRRESDGYVNATAMCKAGGRRWNHYVTNDRTQEYIRALAESVTGEKSCGAAVAGNPADPFAWSAGNPADLIANITTGPNDLRGTWIHPRLAVDLARWISPAFAVWMDGWFLESLAAPALPQAQPHHLPEGVHVVAATQRRAAELWWQAIESEVHGALARRLNPAHRTDAGLPLVVGYQWQQLSLPA